MTANLKDVLKFCAENQDAISTFMDNPTMLQKFAENKESLEKLAEVDSDTLETLVSLVNGFSEKEAKKPRAKRRKTADNSNYPDGKYWGEDGKPRNAAQCKEQLSVKGIKPGKVTSLKKLLAKFEGKKHEPSKPKDGRAKNKGFWGDEGKPTIKEGEESLEARLKNIDETKNPRKYKLIKDCLDALRTENVQKTNRGRKFAATAAERVRDQAEETKPDENAEPPFATEAPKPTENTEEGTNAEA